MGSIMVLGMQFMGGWPRNAMSITPAIPKYGSCDVTYHCGHQVPAVELLVKWYNDETCKQGSMPAYSNHKGERGHGKLNTMAMQGKAMSTKKGNKGESFNTHRHRLDFVSIT